MHAMPFLTNLRPWKNQAEKKTTCNPLMHLQQTTFENIVTTGEIAHAEQFVLCYNFTSLFNNWSFVYKYFCCSLCRCFEHLLLQICCMSKRINPFPHIDAFWCLCSKRLFENIVTKLLKTSYFSTYQNCFHF